MGLNATLGSTGWTVELDPDVGGVARATGDGRILGVGALPVPARAGVAKVAVFGDSIAAFHTASNATDPRGGLVWALNHAGHPFNFDASMNFGVGGDTTTQILARVNTVIAAAPARVYLSAGINDIPNGLTYAQTISNLGQIVSRLLDAGISVDYRALAARSNSSWSTFAATGRAHSYAVNEYMRSLAVTRPGLNIIGVDSVYLNSTSTTGDPFTNFTTDGLHPSNLGAFAEGLVYAQILTDQAGPHRRGLAQAYPDYAQSGNAGGNILWAGTENYGAMAGSNALAGTGYSGNWADGIAPSRLGGTGTMAGTMEDTAITIGGVPTGNTYRRQVVTFTGASTTDSFQLRYNVAVGSAPPHWATGDVVFGECEVEFASLANCTAAQILITEGWGSFLSQRGTYDSTTTNAIPYPTGSYSFTLRTPPLTVSTYTAGGMIFDMQFAGRSASAISGAVKIGRPRVINLTAGGYY